MSCVFYYTQSKCEVLGGDLGFLPISRSDLIKSEIQLKTSLNRSKLAYSINQSLADSILKNYQDNLKLGANMQLDASQIEMESARQGQIKLKLERENGVFGEKDDFKPN